MPNEVDIEDLYGLIQEYLKNLIVQIWKYFPDEFSNYFCLTINPFNASLSEVSEAVNEELIDLKYSFGELQLQEFCAKYHQKFPLTL